MFLGACGNKLLGAEFTSKHQRLALTLARLDGSKFQAAFTNLAAYKLRSSQLGRLVVSISRVEVASLAAADWEQIVAADQSGTWPAEFPANPEIAAQQAAASSLSGFRIELSGCEPAWAISRDFVLLGRQTRT